MSAPDLKQLAALTALNNMFAKGYFNLCTVDAVAKMLEVNANGEAYDVLHTLHCVHFDKMPRELREQVPVLIQQCLGGPAIPQFTLAGLPSEGLDIKTVQLPPAKNGLLRMLGVSK